MESEIKVNETVDASVGTPGENWRADYGVLLVSPGEFSYVSTNHTKAKKDLARLMKLKGKEILGMAEVNGAERTLDTFHNLLGFPMTHYLVLLPKNAINKLRRVVGQDEGSSLKLVASKPIRFVEFLEACDLLEEVAGVANGKFKGKDPNVPAVVKDPSLTTVQDPGGRSY